MILLLNGIAIEPNFCIVAPQFVNFIGFNELNGGGSKFSPKWSSTSSTRIIISFSYLFSVSENVPKSILVNEISVFHHVNLTN